VSAAPGHGSPGTAQVAVGGVAVHDGALLLVRRGHDPEAGRWSIPGGKVRGGETLAAAVEREVLEETGLPVRCGDFVGWAERIGDGYHFVILDFTVHVAEGASPPVAAGDALEASWVPLGDVAGMALVEGLAGFLADHGVVA
jgi:ADP-ribose pyrophosphatase YjhB (NUDIX family)